MARCNVNRQERREVVRLFSVCSDGRVTLRSIWSQERSDGGDIRRCDCPCGQHDLGRGQCDGANATVVHPVPLEEQTELRTGALVTPVRVGCCLSYASRARPEFV